MECGKNNLVIARMKKKWSAINSDEQRYKIPLFSPLLRRYGKITINEKTWFTFFHFLYTSVPCIDSHCTPSSLYIELVTTGVLLHFS